MSIVTPPLGTATVESLKVLVRVRPDGSSTSTDNIVVIDEVNNGISLNRDKKGSLDFKFSGVLGPTSNQSDVYKHCNSVINGAVEGVNTCIMAYGQTGSGKTFSMYGKGFEEQTSNLSATIDSNDNDSVHEQIDIDSVNYGIIPRAIQDLFASLDKSSSSNDSFDFSVNCQIMQIYNEKIYDLLQDKRRENPLQIRESERGSFSAVHVRGLSIYRVYSKDDVMALLRKGIRNRATRATDFNQESSRSHTILQLFIQVEEVDTNGVLVLKRSTLSLVDLAGSEKWRPSLGVAGNINIDVQKEMTNINSSLHVLGNCVSALIESGRKHIPYRDSTLTRLLQDSLSGNGRTVLLATIREDSMYREETYSTLQFASRASKIKVTISVSQGVAEGVTIDEARKQILVLKNKLTEAQSIQNGSIDRASQGEISELKSCITELKKQMLSLWDENNKLREKCGMTKIYKPVILADLIATSPPKGNVSPQQLPAPLFLPEYKNNGDVSVKSDDISEVSLQSLTSLTSYQPGVVTDDRLEDSDNSLTKEVNFVNNIILNNAVASDDIVMPQLAGNTNSIMSTIPKSPSKTDLKILIPISPVNDKSNLPFVASPIVRNPQKNDDVMHRSVHSAMQIQPYSSSNAKPSSSRSNAASAKRGKRISSKSGKRSSSKSSRGSISDAYDSESGLGDRGDTMTKKNNFSDEIDNKPKSSHVIGTKSQIEAALAAARITLSQPAVTYEEEVAKRIIASPNDSQTSPGAGSYNQGNASPSAPVDGSISVQTQLEAQSDRMTKLQSAVAKEFPENVNAGEIYGESNNNETSEIMNKIQEQRHHRMELQETMRSGNSYNQPNPYSSGGINYPFKQMPTFSSSPPIDIRYDRSSSLSNLSNSSKSYYNTIAAPIASIAPSKQFDFSEPCQKHGLAQCILCQMFGGVNMTTQSQSLISNDDIQGNSNDNLSDFESINSYNSSIKPKGATLLRHSHSEDMLDDVECRTRMSPTISSRRISPITTSSSFLDMNHSITNTAKRLDPTVCQTHGVNDCLLCSMRENNSFSINYQNNARSFSNSAYTSSNSGGTYGSNNNYVVGSSNSINNYSSYVENTTDNQFNHNNNYIGGGSSQLNKLSSKALLSYSDPVASSYNNGNEIGNSKGSGNLSQYRPASLAKAAFLPPDEQSQQSTRQYLSPLLQPTSGVYTHTHNKHSAPSARPSNAEYNTYSHLGTNHSSSNATRIDVKSIPNHPHSAHSRLEHTSNTIVLESKRGIHYEDTNPMLTKYSDQDDNSDYHGEESDNADTDYGIDKDRTLAVTHTPSLPSIASNKSLSSMGSNNAESLLQTVGKAKVVKKKKKVKSGRK